MSERDRYFNNDIIRFENFRENIARRVFPDVFIDYLNGYYEWFFGLEVIGDYVRPCLYGATSLNLGMMVFFNIVKKDGSSAKTKKFYKKLKRWHDLRGPKIRISKILDENNGYLDENGGLSIEYGIHIISWEDVDRIRHFETDCDVFGSDERNKIALEVSTDIDENCYCYPRDLLIFHSPPLIDLIMHRQLVDINHCFDLRMYNEFSFPKNLEFCLQIAHGVRINFEKQREPFAIVQLARDLSMKNVVRYCEMSMLNYKRNERSNAENFRDAINHNMVHWLSKILKEVESAKELKMYLEMVNIQEMSGETMKQCAKFLLSIN